MEIISPFTGFNWFTIVVCLYHLCCIASGLPTTISAGIVTDNINSANNNNNDDKADKEIFSKVFHEKFPPQNGTNNGTQRRSAPLLVVGSGSVSSPLLFSSSNFNQTNQVNLIEIYQPISNLTKLDKECSILVDCNQIYYAHCDIKYGQCVCDHGYRAVRGTCIKVVPINDYSYLSQLIRESPFIPILVVLGVMFVCLCLVLHLFSKARFRDQNSSIFVNPQNLKVAQAQERRLSQLSQLSAGGLRTPRTTPSRSPNNSSRSARSSYGSNVYSLNDPATINVSQHIYAPDSVLLKAKSRSNSISSSKLLS